MNASATATLPRALTNGRWWLFPSLLLVSSIVAAAAVVVGNGSLFAALAPFGLVGLWIVWKAPLRIPLLALTFLSLGIDSSGQGDWHSPLAWLGGLLANWTPAILSLLLLIHVHRRLSGSRIDEAGNIGFARPAVWSIWWSSLAVALLSAWGYARGGNLSMIKWQILAFVILLVAAYLLTVSLKGMQDIRILGTLVVAAACCKALLAVYISNVVGIYPEPAVATTHGDAILVTCGIAILVVRFAEAPIRRNFVSALLLVPILITGLISNNRRIAWAELGAVAIALFIMSRPSRLKRVATRGLLLALPLLIVYVAVGWNSSSGVFAPVQTFRSMQDATVDSSTQFREAENYNLLISMRANPWIGSGFGHPFTQTVQTYDISFFKEYFYNPHNSILGLLAFTGVFGFTGLFLTLSVCVFLASRSYRLARSPDERAAAFSAIAMVLIYVIQCWGDIGFAEGRSIFLVGAAIAVAGKVAVSTGAWVPHKRHVRTVRV